ncbi:hypothetical protein E2C01_041338 [Portunus trituberculatus]|uniref:Uncharacterized protein n=1 Tax=Portunus trituberculatus TaxID=210409 RepID=A0A5B7FRM8_PORTR|nr:hypothetical protein [Portunus trituberculatus]
MAKCLRLYVVGFEPTRGRLPNPTLTTLSTMPPPHGDSCSYNGEIPQSSKKAEGENSVFVSGNNKSTISGGYRERVKE